MCVWPIANIQLDWLARRWNDRGQVRTESEEERGREGERERQTEGVYILYAYTSQYHTIVMISQRGSQDEAVGAVCVCGSAECVHLCWPVCPDLPICVVCVGVCAYWEGTLSPATRWTWGQWAVAASYLSGCWMHPHILNFLKIGSCVSNLKICMLYIYNTVSYR